MTETGGKKARVFVPFIFVFSIDFTVYTVPHLLCIGVNPYMVGFCLFQRAGTCGLTGCCCWEVPGTHGRSDERAACQISGST